MKRVRDAASIGIDFGTSNTVVAIAGPDGRAEAITFDHHGASLNVYVTALCFWEEGQGRRARVEGGPFAIHRFLEGLHAHRFVQSFKTFAASGAFQDTRIFRERYRFEDLLAAFLVMGLLNNVVPFSLIFWGQTAIPSGLASILNATTPLWTALLAHALVPGERLTVSKLAGVAVGLAGVAVLIGPQALSGLEGATLAMLAIVGAALSYALSAIYARRFRSTPPLVTAAGQLTASTLMMIPLALAVDQPWTLAMPSPGVMGAVLGLALVSTAFAYLLYFRILAGAGATNAALVTFLVPVSAILLGALFLDERLAPRAFAGMALILAGLVAIDGRAATRLQGKARALRKPELS